MSYKDKNLQKEYQSKWFKENKHKHTKESREWKQERRRFNNSILSELKIALGCKDCGYNANPIALDFDHLPCFKKEFGISRVVDNYSISRILDEVDKCEVVCANCHRIRTKNRRGSNVNG